MNFSLTQNRGKEFAYINQSPRYPTPFAYDDSISICSIDGTTSTSSGRGTGDGQGLSESNVGKEASFSVSDADVAKNGVLRPMQGVLFFTSSSKDEDNKQTRKSKKRRKCSCSSTAMNYHFDHDNKTTSSNAAFVDDSPPRMLLMTPSTSSSRSTSIDVGGTSDLYPRPSRLEILKRSNNIMSTSTLKTSTRRDLYSIFESIDKMLTILTTSQNKKQELHDYYKKSATSTRRAGRRGETKEDSSSSSNQSL